MKVRLIGAALAAGLGVLLSGCGSGSAGDRGDDVASVTSGAPPKAVASTAAGERPLIRHDTSDAEFDRLTQVWLACMKANGDPGKEVLSRPESLKMPAAEKERLADASAKAEKACENKKPEDVLERAQRTDPAYADKLRALITCVRSQGINAWESENSISYEKLPPPAQMAKVHGCEDKVFGGA